MDKNLKDVYHGLIMAQNNDPYHFEKAEDYDYDLSAYNPLCGDHFHLFLNIEEGRIANARFYGYGCAIAKASTSVLVRKIIGKSLVELKPLIAEFKTVFETSVPNPEDQDFIAFQPVLQFPSRIKCATLSWEELDRFLSNSEESHG